MSIAEQMGSRLQNTASSVNIKERLDFSCALFDDRGNLIANAPHMPVHLGSMSESIKTVITRNPAMKPGDVYALNDPYHGGTHLPDVTVVSPESRSAVVDFTGTSAQTEDNFNAPRAVTTAAVLYVFRTLVEDEIPLNAGCLKPIEIIIPAGSMLNPRSPAAVVAGNVEVSTCVTNTLYGVLGVLAGSQPTMNNFTFGNDRCQYYETIAGGSGGGAPLGLEGGFAGTSVVQTHMTNSRLTDPEILELRFPVRLSRYEIRAGSGGKGRFPGGDGGTRAVRFLEPMTAAILSNGRSTAAFGLAGGSAGEPERNYHYCGKLRLRSFAAQQRQLLSPGDEPRTPRRCAPFSTTAASLPQ